MKKKDGKKYYLKLLKISRLVLKLDVILHVRSINIICI
jgi:hypothetical protein